MSNAFVAPHFQSPESAREWLENLRWPEGPICSHCGVVNHAYKTKKPGWYRCAEKECRKDFTVTTGTVMERSHIPLNKWLMAFYLLNASKKGMSAHQLHRALGLDYKSAWFMCHRIREAMRAGGLGPLGGEGEIVEADETYYGKIEKPRVSPSSARAARSQGRQDGPHDKRPIVALVERGGNVRTFHVPVADKATVSKIVSENIAREVAAAHGRKQPLSGVGQAVRRPTRPSSTARTNTCAIRSLARPSTPIQRKAISRSSSAECAAFISIAKRSICIAILPSLITATITAWRSASATSTAPLPRSEALKASG